MAPNIAMDLAIASNAWIVLNAAVGFASKIRAQAPNVQMGSKMALKLTSIAVAFNARCAHQDSRVSEVLIARAKFATTEFVRLQPAAMAPKMASKRISIVAVPIACLANLVPHAMLALIASVASA